LPFSLIFGIKIQINQVVKGKIMLKVKNSNQVDILTFAPFCGYIIFGLMP